MAFKKNKNQQLNIFDSYLNQSERVKKIIQNSWCKQFSERLFPAIEEERFSVLYSEKQASRPNTPVNFIVGALILKEINGLSDDELVEAICCDVRYQYALHTTQLKEQPVSDRTFSRFRERLYNYTLETGRDLLGEEMESLAEEFQNYMKINPTMKRMDSFQVASRSRRLSRLELVYATTAKAIRQIDKMGRGDLIPKELQHYLEKDDDNKTTYYCPGEEVEARLEKVLEEAEEVRQIMEEETFRETTEYQLLIRVIREQAEKEADGNIRPKENKDISANSLQNPNDPDATFRRKAGKKYQGYVCNVEESIGKDSSLISKIGYKQNTYNDTQFCHDYLKSRKNISQRQTMVTDGAYQSPDNMKLAEEKNVELITTNLNGQTIDTHFADFITNEDNNVTCPQGYTPISSSYNSKYERWRLVFSKDCCTNCPHREVCTRDEQKNGFVVDLSKKKIDRAKYLKKISTEEFKTLCKVRNAVEGIPSVFRRKYQIDKIPVFGLIRSKMFVMFKAMAYNFVKLCRFLHKPRVYCA